MEIQNIGNYRGQNMGLRGSVYGWGGSSPTIRAADYKDPPCVLIIERKEMEVEFVGNVFNQELHDGYAGATFNPDGLSPTITTMQGGGETTNDSCRGD